MNKFVLFLSLTLISFSHQGRLDSHGGHTNESTGKYHYHHATKGTSIDPFHAPIRIRILKYGAAYSWGKEFASMERCEAEKKMLTERNKGTDYSYECAIK